MKNTIIIDNFNNLIKQIKFELDNSKNNKERVIHSFRLQNIKNILKILTNFSDKITSIEQLKNIKGIGKNSLKRIDEILKTGKLSEIKETIINNDYLKYVEELEDVFGIGRKKAIELFSKYNIKSIDELKEKYKAKKIDLPENIAKGLEYYGKYKENIPRKEIDEINNYIQKIIKEIDPQLFGVICGSYRRLQMKSNDIDMLLVHPKIITKSQIIKKNYLEILVNKLYENGFIIDSFTGMNVSSKYMGLCRLNNKKPMRRIDIRFIPYESYYYALLYFTGPKDFNRKTRQLAINMNYILNEYGLYNEKGKIFKVSSEKEIFEILGLEFLSPELRK
jgi:DNA polymerase/3'-5' exonuclease PolX